MKFSIKKATCVLLCSALVTCFSVTFAADANNTSSASSNATNLSTGFYGSFSTLLVVNSLYAGYQFTPHLGVQAGVMGIWDGFAPFQIDTATIYSVDARGVLPLGMHAEFFGKLGVGMINAQVKTYFPGLFSGTQTAESIGPTYGLGFGYCFTPSWAATIQLDGIYTTGSHILKSGFKQAPTIGVTYHFNA